MIKKQSTHLDIKLHEFKFEKLGQTSYTENKKDHKLE